MKIKKMFPFADKVVMFGTCENCGVKEKLTAEKICVVCSDEKNYADAGGWED